MGGANKRIVAFDCMRGVAAIAVVVFHCGFLIGNPRLLSHGGLAVDVFFIMSGFVVAQTYEGRLRSSLLFIDFVRIRVARLYPTYLVGAALGTVSLLAAVAAGRPHPNAALSGLELAGALMLAPIFQGANVQVFPLNGASWSLFVELAINLAYARLIPRLTNRALCGVMFVAAGLLVFAAFIGAPLELGGRSAGLWIDFARGAFGFSMGVVLHRRHVAGRLPAFHLGSGWLVAGFLLILLIPPGPWDAAVDLASMLFLLPLISMLMVNSRTSALGVASSWPLAALSYPLYSVHGPLLVIFACVSGATVGSASPWTAGVAFVTTLIVAWAVARCYEPAAARLSRRFINGRDRPSPEDAGASVGGCRNGRHPSPLRP